MSKSKGRHTPDRKKRRSRIINFILVLILLIGGGIIAYPTFSDWWNSMHQSRAVATYANAVENTNTEEMEAMIEAAREYNKLLLTKSNRYRMDEEEEEEYLSLLDLTGNGIMGYIQIPKIGVNLPVYHGTSDSVLQKAIGHIEGTSLPVGGDSTHCAVSGHRGLPSAKLFTDLDKLDVGDVFTVTCMNYTCTYEIDQVRIVEPEDLSELNIIAGEDYCTLITCTPYGVNTHRMLVRGVRMPEVEGEKTVVVLPDALRIPYYVVTPAVGIPLLFLLLLASLIVSRTKRKSIRPGDAEAFILIQNNKHISPSNRDKDDTDSNNRRR